MSDPDHFASPEWRDYAEHVVKELLPKLNDSACAAFLMTGNGPTDVKQAVELGFILMMDKPLILLVDPTAVVPERLRRAADAIVVGEIQHPKTQKLLADAIKRVAP